MKLVISRFIMQFNSFRVVLIEIKIDFLKYIYYCVNNQLNQNNKRHINNRCICILVAIIYIFNKSI